MTEATSNPANTTTVTLQDLQVMNWFASLIPTLEAQLGKPIKYARFEYDGVSVLKHIEFKDEVPPPAPEQV